MHKLFVLMFAVVLTMTALTGCGNPVEAPGGTGAENAIDINDDNSESVGSVSAEGLRLGKTWTVEREITVLSEPFTKTFKVRYEVMDFEFAPKINENDSLYELINDEARIRVTNLSDWPLMADDDGVNYIKDVYEQFHIVFPENHFTQLGPQSAFFVSGLKEDFAAGKTTDELLTTRNFSVLCNTWEIPRGCILQTGDSITLGCYVHMPLQNDEIATPTQFVDYLAAHSLDLQLAMIEPYPNDDNKHQDWWRDYCVITHSTNPALVGERALYDWWKYAPFPLEGWVN